MTAGWRCWQAEDGWKIADGRGLIESGPFADEAAAKVAIAVQIARSAPLPSMLEEAARGARN